MIETDKIYNMDCLEGMSRMPEGSVDAIIADLPYGVLNRGNRSACWDRQIPLGPLWEQYRRIIKPDSPDNPVRPGNILRASHAFPTGNLAL